MWDYQHTNSICVDITATGTRTFESLNGDTTKIGNVLWMGEIVVSDMGNCVIIITNTKINIRKN